MLGDGGRLALGFNGEEKLRGYGKLTSHGFTMYSAERIESLMREAGFARVQTLPQHGRFSEGDYVCLASRE